MLRFCISISITFFFIFYSYSSSFSLSWIFVFFTNHLFDLPLLVAKSSMKNSRILCVCCATVYSTMYNVQCVQCTCIYVLQLSSSPALKLHHGNYTANLMTSVAATANCYCARAKLYNSMTVHVFSLIRSFSNSNQRTSLESHKIMHT